jgi:hypothetical protein
MPDISAPISAHDWFRPKLIALLAEAAQAGYPRDVAEAVITDLINGALAADEPPPQDSWAQDPGERPEAASEMPLHPGAETDTSDAGKSLQTTKISFRSIY